jgi:hypothetical protein
MREIRTSGLMSGDGRRGFATAPILDSTCYVRNGRICDGPLCDGEARIRTFIWWLDLAETGTAAFECATATSRRSFVGIAYGS